MSFADAEVQQKYQAERYERRKELGLCATCDRSSKTGYTQCSTCRKNKERAPSRQKPYRKNFRLSVKERALLVIGHGIIKCVNCSFEDIRFLDINHKKPIGRGSFWAKGRPLSGSKMYYSVLRGDQNLKELDIRCKMCNWLHYYQYKYPEFNNFEVIRK